MIFVWDTSSCVVLSHRIFFGVNKVVLDIHHTKHKWHVFVKPYQMWGLRQKMVTGAEEWKCISSAKWFWKEVSTCVLSLWYLDPRLVVTDLMSQLKIPPTSLSLKKATKIFNPEMTHQHWWCPIRCMNLHANSKSPWNLTLSNCKTYTYKAHEILSRSNAHQVGVKNLTDLLDTVYIWNHLNALVLGSQKCHFEIPFSKLGESTT